MQVEQVVELPETECESAQTVRRWCAVELPQPPVGLQLRRLYVFAKHVRSFPRSRVVYTGTRGDAPWVVYFCYFEGPEVPPQHAFTIRRLKAEGLSVLVVHACDKESATSAFESHGVDGLIWKERRGYDFSGYTVGLHHLVSRLGCVDAIVMNDSVLGPFHSLRRVCEESPWGFTAFVINGAVTPHCMGSAFILKGLDGRRLQGLASVLARWFSFNSQGPVVMLQETRLAAVASKSMSVGAQFSPLPNAGVTYLPLGNPEGMLQLGFPFLKRSIFDKFSGLFDQTHYRRVLVKLGHPEVW
jgi:hypothetical protein